MNNKNRTNNDKKNMNNVNTKTRVSSRSRVVVGLVTALVVITAIGTAIFFAGVVPPAGCQKQDDDSYKCDQTESFINDSIIDKDKSDNWMQIKDGRLVLNPAEQIKLHKGNDLESSNVKVPQQLCGTICLADDCENDLADPSKINIQNINVKKNGIQVNADNLNFLDTINYRFEALPFNNLGYFMMNSSNPEVAIVENDLGGFIDAGLRLISPGKTQIGINLCGQKRTFVDLNVTNEGFSDVNSNAFSWKSFQGLSASKNISSNLDDKYKIKSADLKINIATLEGLISTVSETEINGIIAILASNDDGKTWYVPSQYSENNGNDWLKVQSDEDVKNKVLINNIDNLENRMWRYDFTYSEGYQLKWTILMRLEQKLLVLNQNQQQIMENNVLNFNANGGADNFEIGMTSTPLMDIRNNNDQNPMIENDLVNGGIVGTGIKDSSTYYFLNKLYWPNRDAGALNNTFNQDNVTVENLTPEILQVSEPYNKSIKVAGEQGQSTDSMPTISSVISGQKAGYGKIKVTFWGPAGGNGRMIISRREFGFLVLPQAYLNIDKMEISYTATKTDDVLPPDPGDPVQGIGTSTYIYRGHNRVIVKLAGANDETKNQLKSSFDAKTLKFNYGTDKNNLDKTAKVYYDAKDSKYYAVLRNLQGGEKDGYDQDGFSDGRMQYYYQFKAGNSDIFLDVEKQNTVGDFKTLNRKRTVLYYYNWIFDRKYDLNKDYTWKNVQNGGVDFWYNTDITLPGIRFMMLNDRRYKEFNNYLNKKKTTKKLVAWLYKKGLDRIYDDNLYKFADDNGVNYWYRQMTKIRQKDRISKEGAKFAISASLESRNQLQELFDSKNSANAEFSYNVVLKRGGDQDGVNYLIDTFKDSQKRMREDLANSFEYNNRLETIEKEGGRKAAIAELYETLYARPADVAGVDYWAGSNKTIPQIKEDFLKSDEFVNVLK